MAEPRNTAILFDTVSIQQYVFGSNKLKDNLGASFIVEQLFKRFHEENEIQVGYIGGGNALIFAAKDSAEDIVQRYTTDWLCHYPGLSVAIASLDDFSADDPAYKAKIKKLFRILAVNKGKYLPVNTIPSHGITDVCRFSSLSAEWIETYEDQHNLISSATRTKRNHEQEAREKEKELLDTDVLRKYRFPDETDKLGQKKWEDSHIAIVHIDGNGFGEVFRNLSTLGETRDLSAEVEASVRKAFTHMLEEYVNNKEKFKGITCFDDQNKDTLPVRPIILGGDDVTFICHGKLGIWLAEKFMKEFNSNFMLGNEEKPYSSCAGVAVVKSKYPFYRAYQMAEDLCRNAKKVNKSNKGNWLDFQLAYSGLGNSLEEVRKLQYSDATGEDALTKRPYRIDEDGDHSLSTLKKQAHDLKESLPNSKIKQMREALTRGEEVKINFFEHLRKQYCKKTNNNEDSFQEKFFQNGISTKEALEKYPFFDMIELLELYPDNLLNSY